MKKIVPYIIALLLFVTASIVYFNPVLSGKQIKQGDIMQHKGMANESVVFRKANNQEPYWLGNAFGGMPSYQVSAYYPNDFLKYIDNAFRFLPRPADYLFMYFVSFFVLLLSLKVNWKLAVLGALSFGFSTYLIIIFGAGHNSKAHAIAYMPLVTAGFLYVFRKKYLLGFVLTALSMALELYANHLQMTYYLGFCLLILGVVEAISAYKNKETLTLLKQTVLLLFAVFIALGINGTRLLATKEYAKYSTRGKSDLTMTPDGDIKRDLGGLDKAYITEYSYGKLETFNLIVPRFMGGGTVESLGKDSNFYKVLASKADKATAKDYASQALTYWGDQMIIEAPAYIGAIVLFFFFIGVFLVDNKFKWWLVSATVFSILLSWGRNFSFLTNFFIDYVPLYDKFRAVSSIQVIAEFCVPLLGVLGLKELLYSNVTNDKKIKALKDAFFVCIGIIGSGILFAYSASSFEGLRDIQYEKIPGLIDAIVADRKSMLLGDSFRSVVLILLSGILLFYYLKNNLNKNVVIGILALLVLFDLVIIDTRYVNQEDFVNAVNVQKPFKANDADKQILEDTSHYRVANFTGNFMNEARTSYFHNSIGGYHAAKMKRYQELFDYQFNPKNQNPNVLNMLNAKYLIVGANQVQVNPDANGNAWFVEQVVNVDNADQVMNLLTKIDTKKTAIVNYHPESTTTEGVLNTSIVKDSMGSIELLSYEPNHILYESKTSTVQFAVFSEIYYKGGWNAYVDGEKQNHFQTNYVLRGMNIPAGSHKIEFKFEPEVIELGAKVSLVSYALLLFFPLGWFFFEKRKLRK